MTLAATTVLLVEDNSTDVLLIRRAFDKAKVANPIHVLGDGDAAVAYLSGDGIYADREKYPMPVLILLDLKLPRRSGLEVLEFRGRFNILKPPPGLRPPPWAAREAMVAAGFASSDDVERWAAALDRVDTSSPTVFVPLFSAVGRR